RILSRLSVKIGNPRDLINLKLSLEKVLEIKKFMSQDKNLQSEIFIQIAKQISPDIENIIQLINQFIIPEPPMDIKGGVIIAKNIDKDLDNLRNIVSESREWMAQLEVTERTK